MHALLSTFLITSGLLFAGEGNGQQRVYLNSVLEPASKSSAAFYKELKAKEADGYLAGIYAMDGTLKAEGYYADKELQVAHGTFTFYFPNGKVESQGRYDMGKKSGVWTRNDRWGQPLAEKVYDPKPLENIVYTMAQTMPQYPGGDQAMVKYVREKCGKKPAGKITATFVVEKDGQLTDVKVLGAEGQEAEQIAQVFTASPRWEAGMNEGLPVRVQMRVPIK